MTVLSEFISQHLQIYVIYTHSYYDEYVYQQFSLST